MPKKSGTPTTTRTSRTKLMPQISFTVISPAEAAAANAKRKADLKLYDYGEVQQLSFPGYFIAFLDYYATGEGLTRGIHMGHFRDYIDLKQQLLAQWGDYFVRSCEVRAGLEPIPGYEDLIPKPARTIARNIQRNAPMRAGNFSFSATLHANYA